MEKCLDNPIFKNISKTKKILKPERQQKVSNRILKRSHDRNPKLGVTVLKIWQHSIRKENLMGGNKGSTDIEMVFKCFRKHHKRQPLAHIWKWFLWDFSQEFPNLSPDYINVVFGSERVCCLRAAGICAPNLLEWAGQLSAYKRHSRRCQECRKPAPSGWSSTGQKRVLLPRKGRNVRRLNTYFPWAEENSRTMFKITYVNQH